VYADLEALVPLGFTEYESLGIDPNRGRDYYVFSDPVGMPLRIEDREGDVVWLADSIDPYGQIAVRQNASLEYNLRWPGHYFDPETGLHYNRYRYYEPLLGRYLQSDPLGYAGSDLNLYAYCPNPLMNVDILGLAHNGKKGGGDDSPEDNDGQEAPGKPSHSDGEPKPPRDMSDAELAAAIRDNPKDGDPNSAANQLRYERYVREGGELSPDAWFGSSRGGRPGNEDHQADVSRNNGPPNNLDPNAAVGPRVPDGTGEPGQVVTIRDRPIDPGPDARVVTESERFGEGGNMDAEGRRQVRDMREADPNSTIVVTDPARPDADPVVYPPGTQPPPVVPGKPIQPGAPTHVDTNDDPVTPPPLAPKQT
jgi:RHS repeat-associated protein